MGQRFRNTAKPLFFLLPFLFQCLTHTEKACKMFRYSPRHGNGRAQVFITCVSFTDSSPITLTAGVVCSGRGMVCYLLGIFPPILTACLSSICVQVHIRFNGCRSVRFISELRCKGTNLFANVQTFCQKSLFI